MITDRVRALLGSEALVGTGVAGQPMVAPAEEAAVALLLHTANAEGWRVAIAGLGQWCPADRPADLALEPGLL